MAKVKRKIITINEQECNGCGNCIPVCPEQAIQIIDGKAKLVKEFYCDGLGACLGSCPTGALAIEEREAEPYDEKATIGHINKTTPEMPKTHQENLKEHAGEHSEHHSHEMPGGVKSCPSMQVLHWEKDRQSSPNGEGRGPTQSELRQWPIQLMLIPPQAPYLKDAELILVADCVAYAYPDFHADFLKGKTIAIGCPKLDDMDSYIDKVTQILNTAGLKKLTVIYMEIPCCQGLVHIAQEALNRSGNKIPFETVVISIRGEQSN